VLHRYTIKIVILHFDCTLIACDNTTVLFCVCIVFFVLLYCRWNCNVVPFLMT